MKRELHRTVSLATTFALAGVLAFATGITGLAAALALTGILTFTTVLSRIGVIGQLALADGLIWSVAAGGRMNARSGSSHQPGEGNGGEHGLRGLEEAWIFHVSINPFLFSNGVITSPFHPASAGGSEALSS